MAQTPSTLQFTVFKRKERKGWWYQFREGLDRSSQMSVSALVKRLGIEDEYPEVKTRRQAERIVMQGYNEGLVKPKRGGRDLLEDYLMSYWDFHGPRITRANKRRPGSVGENYASIMQGCIKNHIVPLLKRNMEISDVTPRFVRNVSNKLIDNGNLANATIEKIMSAFTKPLRDAWNDDMIHENPIKLVESLDTSPKRQRGILTRSEFQKVLLLMKADATEHVYLAVMLAAATGMRLGEIRSLYASDIDIVNEHDAIVSISKSWSVKGGEKTTKGKKSRYAPCPTWLAEKLIGLAKKNARGSSLVFWSLSETRHVGPVSSSYIRESFYKYLWDMLEDQEGVKVGSMVDDIAAFNRGVTDKEGNPPKVRSGELIRRNRNISFHSFRHFFNTEAQALGADGDKLRLTVGHESKAMTDNYTHHSYELVKSIADISHQIVGEAEIIEEDEEA